MNGVVGGLGGGAAPLPPNQNEKSRLSAHAGGRDWKISSR